jgi:hypothetical protein
MLKPSAMSKDELISELRNIARGCRNDVDFQERVKKELPGIAATVIYDGPMYMGMAMSFHHPGSISF